MNKIENSKQLKLEIKRLEALIIHKENLIKNNLEELQNQFMPSNIIKNTFADIFKNPTEGKNLVANSLSFVINLILKKTLFRSKGFVGSLLSFGAENLVSKLIFTKSGNIMDFLSGLTGNKKEDSKRSS